MLDHGWIEREVYRQEIYGRDCRESHRSWLRFYQMVAVLCGHAIIVRKCLILSDCRMSIIGFAGNNQGNICPIKDDIEELGMIIIITMYTLY